MAQQNSKLEAVVSRLNNSRAISPVIGVVLLVAITVVLSGLVGTLIFGFGQNIGQMKPTADFVYMETDSGAVSVTHEGGDSFDMGTVEVVYTNQTGSKVTATWQGPIHAGDSPQAGPFTVKTGTTLRIVWHAPDSDQSYTVGSYEAPE